MSRRLPLVAGVLAVVGALGWTPAAQAQPGPYPQAYGGFTWADGYGWYWLYRREPVPYYALYPPVYYSYPVPRPYGYSPFAYPPGVATPQVQFKQARVAPPKRVQNPFVRSPVRRSQAQVQPKRVLNPFVELRQARTP